MRVLTRFVVLALLAFVAMEVQGQQQTPLNDLGLPWKLNVTGQTPAGGEWNILCQGPVRPQDDKFAGYVLCRQNEKNFSLRVVWRIPGPDSTSHYEKGVFQGMAGKYAPNPICEDGEKVAKLEATIRDCAIRIAVPGTGETLTYHVSFVHFTVPVTSYTYRSKEYNQLDWTVMYQNTVYFSNKDAARKAARDVLAALQAVERQTSLQ